MHVIRGVNVHSILPEAMEFMHDNGGPISKSRAGDVVRVNYPVATVYAKPQERVIFHPWRDANPFFHFYESLWMLAGRRDVAPLARYVKRMETFSDDGKTFNAAYGWRWRTAQGDQLSVIVDKLRRDPSDRRCVLQIWDARTDLLYTGRDAACNVSVAFEISFGTLNMTVFCRSNDIIWGCYGANAVHFSMLQEYVARAIGVEVGFYTQISVNWHAYVDVFAKTWSAMNEYFLVGTMSLVEGRDPYAAGEVAPYPIMSTHPEEWDEDCRAFITSDGRAPSMSVMTEARDSFFRDVALPIVRAHDVYRDNGCDRSAIAAAIKILDDCAASDWRVACQEWLLRRMR